nr:MAG TPA: hypothetical protein [Caudoviricetes sp.]
MGASAVCNPCGILFRRSKRTAAVSCGGHPDSKLQRAENSRVAGEPLLYLSYLFCRWRR